MTANKQPEALIWGAGKIGRGFLAEIFHDAGYKLTFIEYFDGLVKQLREAGSYTIHKAMGDGQQKEIKISDFEVYQSSEVDIITEKIISDNSILSVAVHQAALPEVVKVLVPGIMKKARLSPESTIDIILCINMLHPAPYCRQLFEQYLPEEFHDYFHHNVGLVESVVLRMAPEATQEMLAKDPLAVLNNGYPEMPVDKLAFKGKAPKTTLLRLSDKIRAEEVRKIYTLNMAHAMLAYLGTPKGYIYAADCILDPDIREAAAGALLESAHGLIGEYGFTEAEMIQWNKEIIQSLENPALRDKLDRLGADSRRKLGKDDRLTGPALLCAKYDGKPSFLAKGIAYGFRFSQANDKGTEEVQNYLKEQGIHEAVRKFCGLEGEELAHMIEDEYNQII